MAKFKVGDKVKVKGAGVETIKAVFPKGKGSGLDSTQVDMSVDWYETDGGGMIADEDIVGIANSRACNSTNPVVANAMRARNATYQYHDYDVPVIQLGQRKYITIRGVADEETAKALARSSPGITIDESRKVKVKNACGGVAHNYSRDTESFAVRKQFESQLERIVMKFVSEISAVNARVRSEYRRLQKSDPENAFWVDEVSGWIDSLKEAMDDAW